MNYLGSFSCWPAAKSSNQEHHENIIHNNCKDFCPLNILKLARFQHINLPVILHKLVKLNSLPTAQSTTLSHKLPWALALPLENSTLGSKTPLPDSYTARLPPPSPWLSWVTMPQASLLCSVGLCSQFTNFPGALNFPSNTYTDFTFMIEDLIWAASAFKKSYFIYSSPSYSLRPFQTCFSCQFHITLSKPTQISHQALRRKAAKSTKLPAFYEKKIY